MVPKKVSDLMVPIQEYATVPQDATLFDAVVALDEARERNKKSPYHHRAVLVVDGTGNVVGKLSHWVAIRALEPKYGDIADSSTVQRFGFSRHFLKSIIEAQGMWSEPLDEICRKAANLKVEDIMYAPSEGEYVDEHASLEQGIHQLVLGHHQSLLVTRQETKVVGVLRLVDVFNEVCRLIIASRA